MPNPVKIESCLNSSSEKIIKDVIYGYISIPRVIIEDFVDTKYFQRLRGVEQTNTSVIFPSATHTRFSHSLGVFNLAKNAFHWLIENTSSEIIQNKAEFKKSYLTTVWIASLLHDIGHAPFSHICEGFFCLAGNDYYLDQFFQVLPSLRQDYDIAVSTGRKPAPHELMSCLLSLTIFKDKLDEYSVNTELFCRMIMGIVNEANQPTDPIAQERKEFENILIKLLNAYSIDVDKIDYISRDAFSAGIQNVSLDVERLLQSFTIARKNGAMRLCFRKSALSVVKNVIDNRNYLYTWILGHHKVVQDAGIKKLCISFLDEKLKANNSALNLIGKIFSLDAISDSVEFDGMSYSLVNDYDIISMIKKYKGLIPELYEQIFSRFHLCPLWKTYIEFKHVFHSLREEGLTKLLTSIEEGSLTQEICNKYHMKLDEIHIFKVTYKIVGAGFNEIHFYYQDSDIKSYEDTFGPEFLSIAEMKFQKAMFYIYVKRNKSHLKDSIITYLQKQFC